MMPRWIIAAGIGVVLAGCETVPPRPAEELDPRGLWFTHDAKSTETIDHGPWQHFLETYAEIDDQAVTRIAYEDVTRQDKKALAAYLDFLNSIRIADYNRDEQIAFWMNLYNAAIAHLVLDHWPVDSILQIRGPGVNVVGPWLENVARIEGKSVSFNDIEHHILRPAFGDMGPPIHYGVNCASIGCPTLAVDAHTGTNWRDNLEESARLYVNSPQGVTIEDDELFVSKVYFSWFIDDFGGTDEAVIEHLMSYAEPELAEQLSAFDTITSDYYDWRINKR